MSSIATCVHTSAAALRAGDRVLGPDRVWKSMTDSQAAWLRDVYRPCADEGSKVPEIVANATNNVNEHIAFLKKHGWEAQIQEVTRDGFLLAAVIDVLVEWLAEGTPRPVHVGGNTYAGAHLPKGVQIQRTKTGLVIAKILTKKDDTVMVAVAPRVPKNVTELVDLTCEVFDGDVRYCDEFDGLTFPMVSLAVKQQLSHLVGLNTVAANGSYVVVADAIQQATLKMNHKGARARAADEFRLERCIRMTQPPLVIDRPFLVSFTRSGLTRHLFDAYVDVDAWKDPGGLDV